MDCYMQQGAGYVDDVLAHEMWGQEWNVRFLLQNLVRQKSFNIGNSLGLCLVAYSRCFFKEMEFHSYAVTMLPSSRCKPVV
jgi:hypothetical protein